MTFGEKIQKLRKEAGLSQEELSYQLEVSRQAISKWERDNGYPETEKIVRMSKLFNVSLDYLLNEEDTQKPEINPDEKGIYGRRIPCLSKKKNDKNWYSGWFICRRFISFFLGRRNKHDIVYGSCHFGDYSFVLCKIGR